MRIKKVKIKNFRLLADVELALENETTLIVGRNNSGKTSLSEVIRRFLTEQSPKFQIEDFSSASYDEFCQALKAKNEGKEEDEIRTLIPSIELRIFFQYDPAQSDLGPISDFIIDLDPASSEALVVARYELRDGGIDALFEGQPSEELDNVSRPAFFRVLRERVPSLFTAKVWAEDPGDPTNSKQMPHSALRTLLRTGFVNAQRGLDDNTSKETDVLAKILENLFVTAMSATSDDGAQQIAQALQEAVQEIQERLDTDFNGKLKNLMPTLAKFGYPGLDGAEIETETTLDVKRLLSNHTKVRYAGCNGVLLPESYNGLGVRNLVFILLQIVSFHRMFRAETGAPAVQLVFIEEPEAHLHPQIQEVFIRQLSKIANLLNAEAGNEPPWPVQFVVSTHSSHIANAAGFETIRYFLPGSDAGGTGVRSTQIKDLRFGLQGTPEENKKFLHQYLTLTRCDLFFADKAVLVEGTSERLLLPVIIRYLEAKEPAVPSLSSQYMTIMEVGGAYAQIFFELLEFLELRSLIITDLDSVLVAGGAACPVHQGTTTSNACIKAWFTGSDISLSTLLAADEESRINGIRRIAFQRPENDGGPCGRSFEDAFMLANPSIFDIQEGTSHERAQQAWDKASKVKKSEFALKHAIYETSWTPPGYILDGLRWLASGNPPDMEAEIAILAEAASDPQESGELHV